MFDLYKAKIKDNDKWINGHFVYHEKIMRSPVGDTRLNKDEVSFLIFTDGFADWSLPRALEQIEVDPITLCRLCDENRKLGYIWENDIFSYEDNLGIILFGDYENDGEGFKRGFYIYWAGESFKTEIGYFLNEAKNGTIKVIGNIFDSLDDLSIRSTEIQAKLENGLYGSEREEKALMKEKNILDNIVNKGNKVIEDRKKFWKGVIKNFE